MTLAHVNLSFDLKIFVIIWRKCPDGIGRQCPDVLCRNNGKEGKYKII